MKVTNKWKRMGEIYKRFCPIEDCYDFGKQSEINMFLFESTGNPKLCLTDKSENGKFNGYLVGKHWMDVTIEMWREDIVECLLSRKELEEDFPEWFLTKIKI